jgi:hypothetical protein
MADVALSKDSEGGTSRGLCKINNQTTPNRLLIDRPRLYIFMTIAVKPRRHQFHPV